MIKKKIKNHSPLNYFKHVNYFNYFFMAAKHCDYLVVKSFIHQQNLCEIIIYTNLIICLFTLTHKSFKLFQRKIYPRLRINFRKFQCWYLTCGGRILSGRLMSVSKSSELLLAIFISLKSNGKTMEIIYI